MNFFIGGNFLLLLGINIDLGLNGINLSRYRSHTITCRGGTASVAAAGIDFGDKLINKPDRIEGEIIQILQPFNKNIISLPKSKYRLIKIEKTLFINKILPLISRNFINIYHLKRTSQRPKVLLSMNSIM